MSPRRGLLAVAIVAAAACTPPARPKLAPLPPEAYAHYLRGRTAFFEGDYERAVDELARARVAADDQIGIAVALAEALDRTGRKDEARAEIDEAVARWPRSPEVWLAAGEIRRGDGALARASQAYRRAIALDPALIDAYLGLAVTETRAQRPDEAERVYQALVAARPDAAEGHFRLAEIALARDDDRAAEAALRQVLELDGDRVDARRALAGVLVRTGRLADAIAETRLAFDRSGYDPALATDLVWLLIEAGDRRGAADVLGLYDDGVPAEVQADAAGLWLAIGEPERALTTAAAAARRGHDAPLVRARALVVLGDPAAAAAVLAGIERGRPLWAPAQALAADVALAAGKPDDARAIADAAHQAAPDHVGVTAAFAEARRRGGDVATGRAAFAMLARRRPRDAALVLAWSSFEARAGDRDRALTLAEKVLAATPDDPAALNLVAYTLVELGRDLPRARRLLVRARGLAPGDPGVLDSWAWLRRAEGDLAAADRALLWATRIAPFEPEILLHAAIVAEERGGAARARRLLTAARTQPMAPEVAALVDAKLAALGGSPVASACYARADMRTPALLRFAFGSVLALTACKKTPSKDDCEKLLAHLVDLQASAGGAAKAPAALGAAGKDMKAEVDAQKKAIRDYAVDQKFMETCTQSTPKKVVECGLAAKDEKQLADCDAQK